MPQTYSQPIELNAPTPGFDLPAANPAVDDVGETTRSLGSYADAAVLVVVFTCNHCPYALHVEPTLIRLARNYKDRGVRFVAISSNDAGNPKYESDSFEHMAQRAEQQQYPYPYLYDASQEVARAYGAVCTPDLFVFGRSSAGGEFQLKYHGRVDETRPGQGASTGADLALALDEVLRTGEVSFEQYPSVGCSIKWKPGNEPAV